MLSSLYLSCSVCSCCCVATSCVFTKSICCVGPTSSGGALAFRGAGAFRLMLSRASLLFTLKSGCLNSQAYALSEHHDPDIRVSRHTPGPYGEVLPSSLLCRTLWKSYLLSCRTKLAKLLCLKCLGRICFVNFSFYNSVSRGYFDHGRSWPTSRTTKLSPSFPHLTTLSSCGLSSILRALNQFEEARKSRMMSAYL